MPLIKPLMFCWQGFQRYHAAMKKLEKIDKNCLAFLRLPVKALGISNNHEAD
ncbi:MAG: hypothetical protein ACTS73_02865 [Arsenophonus sp. NEOnobi-MAG3]